MQAFALALLLALSAPTETAVERHALAIEGLRSRQTLPSASATEDPCAVAREIVRERPCLAADDCRALQLWQRSFGPPRLEPLDPDAAGWRALPAAGETAWRARPGEAPRRWRPLPFAVCPAPPDPRR